MTSYIPSITWARARRALAMAGTSAALLAGGCMSTDEILSVQDPDIINPEDVTSPAGANAVRLGAIARLNAATTGGESMPMLGGMLADEWRTGDTFIARDEIDQRQITRENSFLTTANRSLHRARLSATQAIELLQQYSPTAPGWHVAEMYFIKAYIENIIAEHYCNGVVFSTVVNSEEQLGSPVTTTETLQMALADADAGLALITGTTADDIRVRSALQTVRGRILLNLNQPANARTAVTGVATTFRYNMAHSQTTNSNQVWALNNSERRYAVSAGEGLVGLAFAASGDPRLPTCVGGSAACVAIGVTQNRVFDNTTLVPFHVQMLWPTRDALVAIVSGQEARLIEAEAQLAAGDAGWLTTLNTLRATVPGLAALADPGTAAGRQDLLFRERAFWLFGRGYRLGDMRRLVRQYGRAENTVFPNGPHHRGGNYGPDVNFPIPQAEDNNPNVVNGGCIDRNA
jgi:starch-binding outer membrane protein, SusD/RagB family